MGPQLPFSLTVWLCDSLYVQFSHPKHSTLHHPKAVCQNFPELLSKYWTEPFPLPGTMTWLHVCPLWLTQHLFRCDLVPIMKKEQCSHTIWILYFSRRTGGSKILGLPSAAISRRPVTAAPLSHTVATLGFPKLPEGTLHLFLLFTWGLVCAWGLPPLLASALWEHSGEAFPFWKRRGELSGLEEGPLQPAGVSLLPVHL